MNKIKEIRATLIDLWYQSQPKELQKNYENALNALDALIDMAEARDAELIKDRDYWQALATQFHDAVHAEVDRRNAEIERRAKVEI